MNVRRLAVLLVGAAWLDPVHEAVSRGLDAAKGVIRSHEVAGLLLFVLLSALSAILFSFSTAVIVPVAVHRGDWRRPPSCMSCTVISHGRLARLEPSAPPRPG